MSKWEMVRLGDVATFINGFAFKPSDWNKEGLPIIRIQNLNDVNAPFNFYLAEVNEKYIIEDNDILISWSASLGIYEWNGGRALLNQHIFKVVFDKINIHKNYFIFAIKNILAEMLKQTHGSTMKHITKSKFDNIRIPIPPMDIQKQIAATLDSAKELISLHKQRITELDILIKSQFAKTFENNGKKVPLTDYVWFQEGPGVRSVDFTDSGTILLTGSNINNNEITFGHKSDRFISHELAKGRYKHFICDVDDILVVSSAIAPEKFDQKVVTVKEQGKFCLNTGIIRFKPNKQYLTRMYFREFLKTNFFKHQVISEMRGIAQMHFGPSHLKGMTILLPDSLAIQHEFSKFVYHVDMLKHEVEKSIQESQLLFDSLMSQYFE